MADADVTRKALTLDARDSTTGWPAKSYTESTIKGSFDPGTVRALTQAAGVPLGGVPYTSSPFYTANYVARGDRIVTAASDEYELTMVTPIYYLDQFVMYACTAEKLWERSDRAATSGTWHTDSESVTTDPRNRIKTWIDTYISHSGPVDITVFAGGDYPLEREFTELHTDLLVAIETVQSTPSHDYRHKPYKYTETVAVTCTAKDTAIYTAVNILETYEQAIREVAADYPHNLATSGVLSSIRNITSTKPERVNIGGCWLWQTTITVEYVRANDDYEGSGICVTWGPTTGSTGTFYFPNVTRITYPSLELGDVTLNPPGRVGDISQFLGMGSLEIAITCDLDAEPAALTWKRPQTTASKTDDVNFEIFLDIMHNAAIDESYQVLTLDWANFQVRLIKLEPAEDGEGSHITATFREYNSTSSTGTYVARWGVS